MKTSTMKSNHDVVRIRHYCRIGLKRLRDLSLIHPPPPTFITAERPLRYVLLAEKGPAVVKNRWEPWAYSQNLFSFQSY